MERQAVLVVSFGATEDETRKRNIEAIEKEIGNAYPNVCVRRAFTSRVVIERLNKRGICVDTVEEALGRLKQEGFSRVIVLATHLLPGAEYGRLREQAERWKEDFSFLHVTEPLLSSEERILTVAGIVRDGYPVEEEEALLLMGHGTTMDCGPIYQIFAEALRKQSASRAYVATLTEEKALPSVLEQIRKDGCKRIALAPLMLVAGEHARKHMAGDGPDSWKSCCIRAGFPVRCILSGLGELSEVRKIYRSQLEACMKYD